MTSEILKINGIPVKLYSDSAADRTVLAIHGFGGSKDSLAIEGLAQRLCAQGFRIAAPDLPCHGQRTEPESELTPQRCISDITVVEDWLRTRFGGELNAFATSFGGCCILQRLELRENCFRRVVLRVPAVNMAGSLLQCMKLFQPEFTLEQAKTTGFHVKMSRELHLHYAFYEQLLALNEVRHSDHWDTPDILTVYSGRDELVARADTEEFLRLNPKIRSLCIENSGHRMNQDPAHLEQALNTAAEFLLT
ncbi:MAG: alpha/beta hydrolase [Oscillospiraceae bacterium]